MIVAYKNDANSTTGTLHKDYVQSAAAAIENLLLMAYNKGLGACWICDIPESQEQSASTPFYIWIPCPSIPTRWRAPVKEQCKVKNNNLYSNNFAPFFACWIKNGAKLVAL